MGISVSIKKKLRNFDLDVEWNAENELVALFGYSGSGKTMTLRSMSGIVTPDSGRICIGSRCVYDSDNAIDLKPQKRKTGYVFQDLALFPHMSVWDNIAYGLDDRKSYAARQTVSEMIDVFHLKGLEQSSPAKLSGGQRQRVAFARSLAVKPDLLLLDEPFSALDSMIRLEMRSVLISIQKTFQMPVVLVTHDFPEALEVADKIVVYSEGRIQQTGKPWDVFSDPANEKVAELMACWKKDARTDGHAGKRACLKDRFDVICGGYHAA